LRLLRHKKDQTVRYFIYCLNFDLPFDFAKGGASALLFSP